MYLSPGDLVEEVMQTNGLAREGPESFLPDDRDQQAAADGRRIRPKATEIRRCFLEDTSDN
jgi:hypothetical protein